MKNKVFEITRSERGAEKISLKILRNLLINSVKKMSDLAKKKKESGDFTEFRDLREKLSNDLKKEIKELLGDTEYGNKISEEFLEEYNEEVNKLELTVAKSYINKFDINGVTVVLYGTNLSGKKYYNLVKKVYDLLKEKKLLAVWYGKIFVISDKIKKRDTPEEIEMYLKKGVEIPKEKSISGEYSHKDDAVILVGGWTDPDGIKHARMVTRYELETILHELGHKFYYKILHRSVRQKWIDFLRTKVRSYDDEESGETMYSGEKSPILPVTAYGYSNADEAFAEAFVKYCLNGEMTRDQLEFFKKTISNVVDESKKQKEELKIFLENFLKSTNKF